jgi:hypothetical protein
LAQAIPASHTPGVVPELRSEESEITPLVTFGAHSKSAGMLTICPVPIAVLAAP